MRPPHASRSRYLRSVPGLVLMLGALCSASHGWAQDARGSVSLRPQGGVGLMEMPTARMTEVNTLMAGAGYLDPVGHGFFSWQALPWLEATLRWTDVRRVSDDADRSLDVKIRVLDGEGVWPAVAVGFQDMLGRGPTSAEYVVVSKSAGDVDVSLGMSWGYLASRGGVSNPWKIFPGDFDVRDQQRSGVPALKNYFSGKRMGFFGGVVYRLPVDNLELKLEYSSVNVEKVALGRLIKDKFPVNAGLSYRPFSWLEVGAGLVRGNALSFHLAFRSDPDPSRLFEVKSITPPPLPAAPPPQPVSPSASVDVPAPVASVPNITGNGMLARLTKALQDAGIERPLFEMRDGRAVLVAGLPEQSAPEHALTAAYLVFAHLPPDVTTMTLYDRDGGEIGLEGQTYSRDLVVKLARADAAFNDLLRQGGVVALTVDGRNVMGQIANPQIPDEAAVTALADLAPAANGLAVVANAHGETSVAHVAAARRNRAAADLARQLRPLGLGVTGIEEAGAGALRVSAEARGPLPEDVLRQAGQLTYAILHEVEPERTVTLSVIRSGEVVASQALPEGALTQARMAEKEPVYRPGMRYLPLYGYVPWSNVAAPPPPPAWAAAPVTNTEAQAMFAAAKVQGLAPIAVKGSHDGVELAVAQDRVISPAAAVGRAGRAVARGAPASVKTLSVTLVEEGVALGRAQVWRQDLEKATDYRGSPEEVWLHTQLDGPRRNFDPDKGWIRADAYPRFHWWLGPQVQQHFGNGPDDNYRAAVRGAVGASLELFAGVKFDGALSRELAGNLEDIPPRTGTTVPRVRSDIGRYAAAGKTALNRLTASWTLEPVQDFYLRASGGLYEPMFGGIGLEALWRPYTSAWALGAEGYWVKPRDYDQKLGFRGDSSWTGHVSLYREWRRAGLTGVVRLGRYLAEDYGGTLEIYRTFDNGVRIGGYATVTDMSRADYGGGGFAKGIYVSIPLAAVFGWRHLGETTIPFTVLNRDGGQRLDRGGSLYDLTTPGSAWELSRRWGSLMR